MPNLFFLSIIGHTYIIIVEEGLNLYQFRECREMRGHTQKYVALSLGVKAPSVSDWEKGKTNPTLENLIALAKLLNVSTDMLLGVDTISENAVPGLSRTELSLIDDFRSLNKQGKEYILQTMAMSVSIYKNGTVSDVEKRA